jgi:hypothetical protein
MNNLQTFFQQFENWVLADIRLNLGLQDIKGNLFEPDRKEKNIHRPFVAAVILMCCAIDCLAAYRFGRGDNGVGRTFKGFVVEYFTSDTTKSGKSYNSQQVYHGLRNALIHGYTLSKDLALTHMSDKNHLEIENGRVIIDVYSLYFDLESAYFAYKKDLNSGKYLAEFNRRWVNYPLIQYIKEEKLKS